MALSALLAVAPTPPAIGDTVSQIAGDISNGLVSGFTGTLVYVVPTVVIFTAVAWAFSMLRTRRKPS